MNERITTRDLLIYFATMMTLAVLVGSAAWFVLGWTTNLASEPRLFVASQVPVICILIAWVIAIATHPDREEPR